MAQYTDYNGITLYKGSKRLDIGCTDNLQTKIPIIIKRANSDNIEFNGNSFNITKLYPNKCYWLTNVQRNGTINIQLEDPIITEKNKLIEQSIQPMEGFTIETVSSWVQSDYTKGVINHNNIKRTISPYTLPEGIPAEEGNQFDNFLNQIIKANEAPLIPTGDEIALRGYNEEDTGTPLISAKHDSRYAAEHLKNEISDVEYPGVINEFAMPELVRPPQILVEYYFIFAPNGGNTISLPDGYYFADNPQNMTFEQDENGPTVYEVHICNNIVRIGKAIKFETTIDDGGKF